ncbi:MAG: GNAT family N-acetyltransferase [Candidatus Nanopelagicales bacterium]
MTASGVRLARMTDTDELGAINVAAWRDRLGDILKAEVLDQLRPDDLALVWAGAILNPPTIQHRLLVATHDESARGYAAVGPCADADADAATGELIALEVHPDDQRQGHGSRLLAAAVDHARADGFEVLAVWCPVDDEVRRGFLQSAGWVPDSAWRDLQVDPGAPDELEPEQVLREVRLVVSLSTD